MKRRNGIVLCALMVSLTACGNVTESAEAEPEQEKISSESSVVLEQTDSSIAELEEVGVETEEAIEEAEEEATPEPEPEIEVNIENVTITPQENWKLLEYDEASDKVIYQIEAEGQSHEVSIYTIPDFALQGNVVDTMVISNIYEGLAQKFYCHDYYAISSGNMEEGYVWITFMLEEHTRQIACVTGDTCTLVMEAPAYVVNDEVAQNVKLAYDSEDSTKKTSFVSMDIYKACEIQGMTNYYENGDIKFGNETVEVAAGQEETSQGATESTVTETTVASPGADPGHYITMAEAEELGIPIDFTDKTTVVTDGNPNYTILRNGPGPVVKSSYPYIGKTYSMPSGETLVIHSTDYYGAPLHITMLGVDYTFTNRVWPLGNAYADYDTEREVEWVKWLLITEEGYTIKFDYNTTIDAIDMFPEDPTYYAHLHFTAY